MRTLMIPFSMGRHVAAAGISCPLCQSPINMAFVFILLDYNNTVIDYTILFFIFVNCFALDQA